MADTLITADAAPVKSKLGVPIDRIFWLLILIFVVNNWLLLIFLGHAFSVAAGGIVSAGIGLLFLSVRPVATGQDRSFVPLSVLGHCSAIALVLLILGGEGRLLYANVDWQVRDAVLNDMAKNPWPFSFFINNEESMLRAPLGMYLIPALLVKGLNASADLSLLASNTLVLTLLLAGASALFQTRQHRLIALLVLVAFSGLDRVGTWLASYYGGSPSNDHLELWAGDLQYSSNLTLLYWVPQHTFAGWMCALAIVLYIRRQISLGALVVVMPLVALWSPLAIMGAAPFVAWLGLKALVEKQCRAIDVGMGVLALIVALPALKYLTAGSASLHQGLIIPQNIDVFLALEIVPWVVLLALIGATSKLGKDIFFLTILLCCAIPFGKLGSAIDFQMRASITPLAILAFLVALGLCAPSRPLSLVGKSCIVALLLLSGQTGLMETRRAFLYQPSPAPLCSLPQVWTQQTGRIAEIETYVVRRSELPAWLQPSGVLSKANSKDQPKCWSRPWFVKRGSGAS